MNQIKFSHNYSKLGQSKTAKLLAVFPTHYNQLGKDFIEYDTHYCDLIANTDERIVDENAMVADGYYPLPHTDLLVLLFQDSDGLFTTVRSKVGRGGLDKEKYYRERIGQTFDIIFTEEKK